MKIVVASNCQNGNIASCIKFFLPKAEVIPVLLPNLPNMDEASKNSLLDSCDYVFTQPYHDPNFEPFTQKTLQNLGIKAIHYPTVEFYAYHPDIVYVGSPPEWIRPFGDYNSSIALYGYMEGLDTSRTIDLFNKKVFHLLRFNGFFEAGKNTLLKKAAGLGFPLDKEFGQWVARGCFMHSINHPKLLVLADIARKLVIRAGIESANLHLNPEEYVIDNLKPDIIWPVYPGIAESYGVAGSYLFKISDYMAATKKIAPYFDLEEMIEISHAEYRKHPAEQLICGRIQSHRELLAKERIQVAMPIPEEAPRQPSGKTRNNPYIGLPDWAFWRRAVEKIAPETLDPMIASPFMLSAADRIGTAGSCFAQHISAAIKQHGFTYLVTETAPRGLPKPQALERQYGVFSARYGNLYTARQLLQLFDRAYGQFKPADSCWRRPDGTWVDPFRPEIEPVGFADAEAVEHARAEHLRTVRNLFETMDVFIFTLGLTEAWRSRLDEAVFPLAPGVVGEIMDPARYGFVNFDVGEIARDLTLFIDKLRTVNPGVKLILTVSPVPLIATYEPRHVLVSTTYSKSVLRVAAETVSKNRENVAYFPSYEIITGNFNRGRYFKQDLRGVTPLGIRHVMKIFFRHFAGVSAEAANAPAALEQQLAGEFEAVSRIFCEEERNDPTAAA